MLFYNHSRTDRTLTKQRFGKFLTEAWNKAATAANIKAVFRATDIYLSLHPLDYSRRNILVARTQWGRLCLHCCDTDLTPAPGLLSQKTRNPSVPGTSGKVAHQTRGMQSLNLHKKHQNFKRSNTKLISNHSVNSMEISNKMKSKRIIKLPGGSTENKYFQCNTAMNKGW